MMNDHNPWEKSGSIPQAQTAVPAGGSSTTTGSASDFNFMRILRIWPLAVLGGLIGLTVAWFIVRYSVPLYQAKMKLSVKEDISATASLPTATFSVRDPFNDKVDMMKSPTVAVKVVDKLRLNYTAVSKGQFKNKDLYRIINWYSWNSQGESAELNFTVKMNPSNRRMFRWIRGNTSGLAAWNQPFVLGSDSVVLYAYGKFEDDAEIICSKANNWIVARNLANTIGLNTQPQSYTMDVSYIDEVPARAVDILNELAQAYDESTIEYKNKSLQQSIRFIQERLGPLSSELDSLENDIVRFKTSRKIVGNSASASNYLERANTLDIQLNTINLQHDILNVVQRYVNDPNTKDENLSLVGLSDGYLQSLVMNFQELRKERDQLSQVVTEANPNKQIVDEQLAQMKDNIDVQINNYRNILGLQQRNLNNQLNKASGQLQNAPADEKMLLEKQRQQNIKQSLYLLLLQRKEEAAITLASTTSETRTLSPAGVSGPISPKPVQLYIIGLAAGLLLPLGIAAVRELMKRTITSKKQLHALSTAPVIATVDLADEVEDKLYIIGHGDRSAVAEQVRSLRANLSFYQKPDKPLFIMITSSFSGEGKTFISGNLAKTFALQDLRVALLEFDMRKPKLVKRLGMSPKIGLSSMLMKQNKFEEIFIKDPENENLHLYPTGIIPPNPSELMSSVRMQEFRDYLNNNYDVVLMDTPPMGLVSDAQLLTSWADVTLMIVRFGVTPKEQMVEVESWNKSGTLGNMALIFNGVKTSGYYGYKYSPYYYKRKYGYEYYQSNDKSRKNGFFSRKKK